MHLWLLSSKSCSKSGEMVVISSISVPLSVWRGDLGTSST